MSTGKRSIHLLKNGDHFFFDSVRPFLKSNAEATPKTRITAVFQSRLFIKKYTATMRHNRLIPYHINALEFMDKDFNNSLP